MTREVVFAASNENVHKKDYVPESSPVIETENKSLFKQKNFILGVAVGAIFVSLIAAIVVVILNLTSVTSDTSEWSYEHQDEWPGFCLTGSIQSPIALFESETLPSENTPAFTLDNVNDIFEAEVENTGHTVSVKLNVDTADQPKLTGAGLSGNFTLNNIHFHWPSEHTINGKYYDLEAHFVFYNEEYESLDEAIEYANAVTVIGVLFQETETENVTSHDNFDVIDKAVELVFRRAGSSVTASGGISITDFFPTDITTYFQYTGSLTTPECNENVNWIVIASPSTIYTKDLEDLAIIYTEESERLKYNNRDLQSTNSRTVYLHTE